MKEEQYKDFSWRVHSKFATRPIVCQFELTFACPLHCSWCYTDCYNKDGYISKELALPDIKRVLDKIRKTGVLWLCFTGGDPLARSDFIEIYEYASQLGFLITIFSSGALFDSRVIRCLKKRPPFCIEITLNTVDKKQHEEISNVKGLLKDIMKGIKLINDNALAFKIKTLVTRQNQDSVWAVEQFVKGLGRQFRPSTMIHARLNGDTFPCSLRLSKEEVQRLSKKYRDNTINEDMHLPAIDSVYARQNKDLYRCAAGYNTIYVDPSGNMIFCTIVREPAFNLLDGEVDDGLRKVYLSLHKKRYQTDSPCGHCKIWHICGKCPGRAFLETGDEEAPIEYFCKLAHSAVRRQRHIDKR